MNKKILVTGGAGYIGSHTVVELARAGYVPVIVDNFSNAHPFILKRISRLAGGSVKVCRADCMSHGQLRKVFRSQGPFGGIIHFAGLKSVAESVAEPALYYRHNLKGMLNVLEAAAQHGVAHVVFSSSCTVYGCPDKLPVRETARLKPAESPYGETKQIAEHMLEAFVQSKALGSGVAIRYFNPVGAHPSGLIGEFPVGVPHNLMSSIVEVAAGLRKVLRVYGNDYATDDGTAIRDYIHVMDLARAHIDALGYLQKDRRGARYDVFNIGMGRGYSILEIIRLFEKVTGVHVRHAFVPRRPGDVDNIYAHVDKARKVLGWKVEFSLEDALAHAWAWQRAAKIK